MIVIPASYLVGYFICGAFMTVSSGMMVSERRYKESVMIWGGIFGFFVIVVSLIISAQLGIIQVTGSP